MSEITVIAILAVLAIAVVASLLLRKRGEQKPTPLPNADEQQRTQGASPPAESEPEAAPSAPATEPQVAKDEPAVESREAAEAPAQAAEATTAPSSDRAPESKQEPTPSAAAAAASEPPSSDTELKRSAPPTEDAFAAFKRGLSSTRNGFVSRLTKLIKGKPAVDESLFSEIEEILISADIGTRTASEILQAIRKRIESGNSSDADAVWDALRSETRKILEVDHAPLSLDHKPSLILVAGVNGVGKTTTIGKLASRYKAEGRRVLLAAGDTYRAAAVLQLEVWGQRVGCPVVKGKEGADPGSVIFEAITRAREEGYELVIADTAGRLHTKQPLMDELKKVDRTITKALGGRHADEILLVLDATTGQNAVQQMHMFREALNITGVVLTKLDGTAKGGVILGVVSEHKVPVRFVGLGERVEDLREFEAEGFIRALFERASDENLAA